MAVMAREAAEEEARTHAGLAARAAADRAAAEDRAREAVEELREAVAARAAAEAAAGAQAQARAQAEQAAESRATERSAVEAAVRRQAEIAEEAMRERAAAEERALDLAAALAETRALLMDELTIRRRWWQRPQPMVLPPLPADHAEIDATPPGPPPRLAHVDGRHAVGAPDVVTPGDGTDVITFGPPRGAQVRSALLGSAALLAAVVTVLTLTGAVAPAIGVVAGIATVLLAALAWRTRPASSHVRIDRGLVDIVAGDSHHRFDLRNDRTQVEMVGTPGEPDWQVHFVRRSLAPVVLDSRMVNAVAFSEALRSWRPDLEPATPGRP